MLLLLLALIAPFTPSLDLYVSNLFYSAELGFYNNAFFYCMYKYGELFGLTFGFAALIVFFLSFFWIRLHKWRRAALVVVLTLVIGAGLLVNVTLKGYWGRPRPKQVIEFGGHHAYRAFWKPDFHTRNDPQKSFPSGHVAMGFYFLSLCLIGKRYNSRMLYNIGLFLTLFLGGGLMVTRIVQGGHFLSDVLISPVLMWYVTRFVDRTVFILLPENKRIKSARIAKEEEVRSSTLTTGGQ